MPNRPPKKGKVRKTTQPRAEKFVGKLSTSTLERLEIVYKAERSARILEANISEEEREKKLKELGEVPLNYATLISIDRSPPHRMLDIDETFAQYKSRMSWKDFLRAHVFKVPFPRLFMLPKKRKKK